MKINNPFLCSFFLLFEVGCSPIEGNYDRSSDKSVSEITQFCSLPSMKPNQSMAIIDDYALFICHYHGLMGELYDIKKQEYVASISLPYVPWRMPHANTSCFGRTYLNGSSVLPLLYVSAYDEESDRGCFVYDFSLQDGGIKASLVQKIVPDIHNGKIGNGALDWVLDYDTKHIYSIAYNNAGLEGRFSRDNDIVITKFKLPNISNRDVVVYLKEKDIIQCTHLNAMPFNQDKCYKEGLMYIVSGGANINSASMNRLRIISLAPIKVVDDMDIAKCGIKEPEGLDYLGDKLLLNYNDANPEIIWLIDF